MLEGNTSRDSTEKNTAQGTSSTHHVAEYPETTLNAALKIETSLSDTLTLQMDSGQYLTQSSDISNTESMTPTMTLTYHQVDKLEHMATSSVEIKVTSSSALTLTYQLMGMTETAAETMNTGALDMGTSADTQVTTISEHTSAEDSIVTALSLVVLNTDLVDGEEYVAEITRSLTTITDTTHSLPDESTTTLSPEMLKRKLFLKLHHRYLTNCINTFVMPFEETSTCTDKRKVQRNGKPCSCVTGLHFNPYTKACVRHCTTYGRFLLYQSRLFCISGHNDRIINVQGNVRACARACLKETTFVCRSLEIFMNNCYLSRETRATVNTKYWIPYCGCKYYQRTCAS